MKKEACLAFNNGCGLSYQRQLDLIQRAGFDGYYLEWTSDININEIKAYGDSIGLVCVKMNAPIEKMGDIWKPGEAGQTALDELLVCVEACGKANIPMLVVRSCYGNDVEEPTDCGIENFAKLHEIAQEYGVQEEFEYAENPKFMDAIVSYFQSLGGGQCWNLQTEIETGQGREDEIGYGGRIESVFLGDSTLMQEREKTMKRLNRYGYDGMLSFKMSTDVTNVSEAEFSQLLQKQYEAAMEIAEIKRKAVMVDIDDELAPAVFAVGHDYHIMMYPSKQCLMWVKVGDKIYYDEKNGILRSHTKVHRVVVPMEELDRAKGYTLCLRYTINRTPYFPEIEPVQEKEFVFSSLTGKKTIRAYQLADTHGQTENPIRSAKTYGDMDLLIMNGDIMSYNDREEDCRIVYDLASAIAGGQIPIVFARGNHDLRGLLAERYWENTPTDNGNSYYTFRMGEIWGMILDMGEDKRDDHMEYGGCVCCHPFRLRETEFIKDVIARADEEYLAESVKYRLILSHCPITIKQDSLFDIEDDILREWSSLMREHIHPDLMLSAHHHRIELIYPGEPRDYRDQACPLLIANTMRDDYCAGTGLEFHDGEIKLTYTDNRGEIVGEKVL